MTLATAPYGFANGREMPIFVYNNAMTTVKNTNRKPIPNINNSFTSACAHFTLCSRLIDNCAESRPDAYECCFRDFKTSSFSLGLGDHL